MIKNGNPVPGRARQPSPFGPLVVRKMHPSWARLLFSWAGAPYSSTVPNKPACRGERRIVRGVGCVMCVEVSLRSDRPSRENKAICSNQRTPPAGVEAMTQVAPKINDNCVRLCIHFGFIFKIFSYSKFWCAFSF